MKTLDERFLIYSALVILCCTSSVFFGLAAGFWSLIQITAVIEFMYWIGLPASTHSEQF
ncbi:MAG: hypothetical protein IMF06_07065 [Proteobacteria bacterium]|nr:hypothetical protein [Pseudomonadota bacterium]